MEPITDPREQRGLAIAKNFDIKYSKGIYYVPSASRNKAYKVSLKPQRCECPDFENRRKKCKHIYAAQHWIEFDFLAQLEREEKQIAPPIKEPRKTYRQNWKAYNKSQTSEKAEFQMLLASLCKGVGSPAQKCGKPALQLEDMLFACAFKVFSTFSGRRFMTDLGEARDKGYLSTLPHFNSVLRYFDKDVMTPYLEMLIEESAKPLAALEKDFAIDASGLSATHGFSWNYAKFEEPHLITRRDWLKIHICTGVLTNVVTAVKVTEKYEHDTTMFEPLMLSTRENFQMRTICADKGYLSKSNMNFAALCDAAPFIAFKHNSRPTKDENTVWNKMFHFYSLHQEEFLKAYHRRSNVESTFSMIKSKFSGSIRAKNKTSQKNEALAKILCHNLTCLIQSMNEFGVKPDFYQTL